MEAEKALHVIKDAATLIITMNFNKAPRLVSTSPEKKAAGGILPDLAEAGSDGEAGF